MDLIQNATQLIDQFKCENTLVWNTHMQSIHKGFNHLMIYFFSQWFHMNTWILWKSIPRDRHLAYKCLIQTPMCQYKN